MADPQSSQGAQGLVVPAETQAAFGPLVELIKNSESMNTEERQYWINILPIMTPEQIKNLEDILLSEKQQLAAIDAKYSKQAPLASPEAIEKKMKERKEERQKVEVAELQKEEVAEESILSQIQAL